MQLTEKYEILIERDACEISWFWKYGQMIMYLLSAIGGYICSLFFYTLQEYVFGGKCPFWATCSIIPREKIGSAGDEDRIDIEWWEYVHTDYYYTTLCDVYLGTCMSSCIFGVIWFILFMLCGKGGHNISLYERPWRIVLPAMVFNFLFTGVSIYAHYHLGQGYEAFRKSVMGIPTEMYNVYNVVLTLSDCDVIKGYMHINNFYTHHDLCHIPPYLQNVSGLTVCCWGVGLMILLFRMLVVNDFKILKVKIYEMKGE